MPKQTKVASKGVQQIRWTMFVSFAARRLSKFLKLGKSGTIF